MELPAHGAIHYIQEILDDPCPKTVRTFGLDRRLEVDVALLSEQVVIKDGSLYMMIGEVEAREVIRDHGTFQYQTDCSSQNQPLLKVRVARNVDGMDLNLFDAALGVRRKFEAELKT
eukprot:754890-Hanusia_phi.AAC.6